MGNFKKILKLVSKPPCDISNLNFTMIYFIVAVFPSFFALCVSTLVVNIEEINYVAEPPNLTYAITSLTLAPWIETLVFFAPIGWFLNDLKGSKLWCKLASFALIFTAFHYLWGVRTMFAAVFIFWAGLVMAYAYEVSNKTGKNSIVMIACIHTLFNGILLFVRYSAYALTHTAFSMTMNIAVLILLELILTILLCWHATKIASRY